MKLNLLALAPLSLVALAACHCPSAAIDTGPLPPPLTKAQQISLLNARAKAVQSLKALGSITITWTDDNGTHSNSADASILLRQRPPSHPYDPGADVLLIGKIVGSEVFEMGVNAQDHWLDFKVDPNTAYIGPMNVPPQSSPDSRIPLRADRVLTVLALTQLGDLADSRIAMTSNGEAGGPHVNELHIIRFADITGAYIERTLVINRATGTISQIRAYFPDGRVESVADLSDYHPGKAADGTPSAIAFPNRIVIEDPADRSHIELSMDGFTLNPKIPPAAFETPDFAAQGQKVVHTD